MRQHMNFIGILLTNEHRNSVNFIIILINGAGWHIMIFNIRKFVKFSFYYPSSYDWFTWLLQAIFHLLHFINGMEDVEYFSSIYLTILRGYSSDLILHFHNVGEYKRGILQKGRPSSSSQYLSIFNKDIKNFSFSYG